MLAALVLAFGLAMDATAVAAARGLLRRRGEAVALPLLFGAFQAGMAALGWLLGAWGGSYVAAWDHWIAFGLLVLIGGKMIFEAIRGGADEHPRAGGMRLWLLLALATSIDAAAAGITLPLLPAAPWLSLSLIGVVTAACSALGYVAGSKVGGAKLEIAGGVILIGLAVKILVEHLR
jgi:manganese efflux pump family protein